MASSDDLHQLESELEHEKADLRADVSQIKQKLRATRAQLNPTHLVRENLLLLSGVAIALGFILGYRGVLLAESPSRRRVAF